MDELSLCCCCSVLSHVWLFVTLWTAAPRPPCPSPSPGVYSNSWPLSRWCHPTTSSSVIPFSSCLQSFPASGSFPMSLLFASGGQSIGASAKVINKDKTEKWPSTLAVHCIRPTLELDFIRLFLHFMLYNSFANQEIEAEIFLLWKKFF